ncbi:MAG: DMT family transporter [Anaerovoracaceae bacterium]
MIENGKKRLTKKQEGVILMLLSAFLFSTMQIAIKKSSLSVPLMEQVFFRNIVSLVISFIIITKQKGSYLGSWKHQPLLFLRSSFGFAGLVAMFYAVANANQGDVTTLMKLSPFLIAIWAAIFLKEPIKAPVVISLILAFAGAVFVANPAWTSHLLPLFMALACALFSSVSYTLLAYFKNKVDGMTIIFHFSAFCVLATIPFIYDKFIIPDPVTMLQLILIGVLGGFGQITLTYSYRMAPAAEVSIYNYSGIVFSILLGYVFLGEILSWNSYVGIALVLAGSLVVYRFQK